MKSTLIKSVLALFAVTVVGVGVLMATSGGSDKPEAKSEATAHAEDDSCCAEPKAAATEAAAKAPAKVHSCCAEPEPAADVAAAEVDDCCAEPANTTADADPLAAQIAENVRKSVAKAADPNAPAARQGKWTEPTERPTFNLDFPVTDHDGHATTLKQVIDKPTALTFVFTHCPNPNMCPLMMAYVADLEKKIAAAGLSGKVQAVVLSYDPVRDTPEVLRKYGQDHGLAFTAARMLRPGVENFRGLLDELAITVGYTSTGTIQHAIELLIIDSQGRFVRDYQGDVWDNDVVLADLQRLLTEGQATAAAQ